MGRGTSYPPELREQAIRMVAEVRPDYPSDWPAICAVAAKLGISRVNRTGVHADGKRCLECHRRPLQVPYNLLWTARHQ